MPNALLARYFHAHDLFHDLDFAAMKETKPEPLFEAWLELPEDRRNEMDAELREMHALSCEKGWCAIRDEDLQICGPLPSSPARCCGRDSLKRQENPCLFGVRAGLLSPNSPRYGLS